MKTALVLGAGGFIGSHMVRRLINEGFWVRGVDLKYPEFSQTKANEFVQGDLRNILLVEDILKTPENTTFDHIYQFAADMGGAGFVFTGENDAHIMHNSVSINLNILDQQVKLNKKLSLNKTKIFYSGSACMYPEHNQLDPDNPNCREDSAYPANPDSEYGWEKLFSERLYFAYNRNYKIPVRVARYHNIFGPEGTWEGGREKAPAAICRKVASLSEDGGTIEVWGDGNELKEFLYIDDFIDGILLAMEKISSSNPINLSMNKPVTVREIINMLIRLDDYENANIIYDTSKPTMIPKRLIDNTLATKTIGFKPKVNIEEGLMKTIKWFKESK